MQRRGVVQCHFAIAFIGQCWSAQRGTMAAPAQSAKATVAAQRCASLDATDDMAAFLPSGIMNSTMGLFGAPP